ncbi:LCP family protein [Paucisalibacillus globulus]|uniref:LCP family protein n=1 Tax=Paucisalibacillus globulus TaxID=351095 RepID=UPI000BB95EBB|nr:LCP family protein [Paucisalibacillus globulus]
MSFEKKTTRNHANKNKRRIIKVSILTILSLMVITIGLYAFYIYNKAQDTANDSYKEVERENERSSLRNNTVNLVEDNVSILIIGIDDSEDRNFNEQSRSDALMLATFNRDKNSVKLLSIPRDSYVYVPELGYNTKINHAHFYGGPKATIETIEHFLNTPVDYYIRFNFEAFIEVVDSLDGIHFDVPYEMYEPDSHDNKDAIHLMPGYQKLNGEQALALARTRKYDNDVSRGKRQQEIIKALINKATSAPSVFKIGSVMEAIGNNMKTNLTFDDMKSFATYSLTKQPTITTLNLDGHGGYFEDGLWYYEVDEESKELVSEELRLHLGIMQ